MTVYVRARSEQQPALQHLLSTARYSYKNIGDEDLNSLIQQGIVILAYDGPALWGALGISLEERPITLPGNALNRAGINVMAFMPGYWPGDWIPLLQKEAEQAISPQVRPLHVSSYGPATWMERGLISAGFEIEEQIVSLVLDKLQQRPISPMDPPPAQLRPATHEDLPAVAKMDATIFEPLWHFSERNLLELLWRGRMQLALQQDQIVGYSALLSNSKREAQLARLGVAVTSQGQGIGRQLLTDAIFASREFGYHQLALNTQTSNLRSQTLYHAFGFRSFGEKVSVLTKSIY